MLVISLILVVFIFGTLLVAIHSIMSTSLSRILIAVVIIMAMALTLAAHLTKYIFEESELIVDVPLQFDTSPIPYVSIKKIVDTKGYFVAMMHGYSTDAVKIWYDKSGYVCVSPNDKEAFLELLKEKCTRAEFIIQHKP